MKYLPLLLLFLIGCSKDEEIAITPRSAAELSFNPEIPCMWDEVDVIFDNGYNNNCGWSKIEVLLDDTWVLLANKIPVNGVIHARFVPTEGGDYQFRASWTKRGGCNYHNIKTNRIVTVVESCCENHFLSTSICNAPICEYGVEFYLMVTEDCYAIMTATLPLFVDLCGFYDENNNQVVPMSGNEFTIEGDLYGCQENHFFVYFNSPIPVETTWTVKWLNNSMTTQAKICTD